MKKVSLLFLSALVLTFAACKKEETPSDVARKFFDAIENMEFDKAKLVSTEETGKMLDVLSGFANMSKEKPKKEKSSITILSEKVDGDKATVTYKAERDSASMAAEGMTGPSSMEETINLVKVEDQWKVSITKQDLGPKNGGAQGTVPDEEMEMESMDDSTMMEEVTPDSEQE